MVLDVQLTYSGWHRTLGYSYFAMDLDYIEIRNNLPVAVIEVSLCTRAHPNCHGQNGVFDRFLGETGGFQFDVAYWTAKWLGVNAYVVCPEINQNEQIVSFYVLSLMDGLHQIMTVQEYQVFLQNLPNDQTLNGRPLFSATKPNVSNALNILGQTYPGLVNNHPYFNNQYQQRWINDANQRENEIHNGIRRTRSKQIQNAPAYPVKKETTGERLPVYENFRNQINLPYLNLEWVEWRKDNNARGQKLGRPAALIKTQLFIGSLNVQAFEPQANNYFQNFQQTQDYTNWVNISTAMNVDWFYVVYQVSNQNGHNSIPIFGEHFKIYMNGGKHISNVMNLQNYSDFIKRL